MKRRHLLLLGSIVPLSFNQIVKEGFAMASVSNVLVVKLNNIK